MSSLYLLLKGKIYKIYNVTPIGSSSHFVIVDTFVFIIFVVIVLFTKWKQKITFVSTLHLLPFSPASLSLGFFSRNSPSHNSAPSCLRVCIYINI